MWTDVSVISAVFNLFKALYKIRHYNAYLDIFSGPGKWRGPRQLSDGGLINNWWVRVSPARSALSPNNGLDLAVGRPSGGYEKVLCNSLFRVFYKMITCIFSLVEYYNFTILLWDDDDTYQGGKGGGVGWNSPKIMPIIYVGVHKNYFLDHWRWIVSNSKLHLNVTGSLRTPEG